MRVFTHSQVCKMTPQAELGQMIISCADAFMGEKQGQHYGGCRVSVCELLGFNGMLSAGLTVSCKNRKPGECVHGERVTMKTLVDFNQLIILKG